MLYSWGSTWERDENYLQAETEFEALQMMSEAGKASQRQLADNLLQIFQSENPDQVVLLQFMSALQSMVNRSDFEKLLPRDANTLLNNVEVWFKRTSEGSPQ